MHKFEQDVWESFQEKLAIAMRAPRPHIKSKGIDPNAPAVRMPKDNRVLKPSSMGASTWTDTEGHNFPAPTVGKDGLIRDNPELHRVLDAKKRPEIFSRPRGSKETNPLEMTEMEHSKLLQDRIKTSSGVMRAINLEKFAPIPGVLTQAAKETAKRGRPLPAGSTGLNREKEVIVKPKLQGATKGASFTGNLEQDVAAAVQRKLAELETKKTANLLGTDGSLSPLLYGLGGAALGGLAGTNMGSTGASLAALLGGMGGVGIANAVNLHDTRHDTEDQQIVSDQLQALLQGRLQ